MAENKTPRIGRPAKFKSPSQVRNKLNKYFKDCYENGEPPLVTGMALALGTNRETLLKYEDGESPSDFTDEEKQDFSDTIKAGKAICENYSERQLFIGKNTGGVIFSLANNFKWKNTIRNELADPDGKPLYPKLTDEQLDARIKAQLRKTGAVEITPGEGAED